LIVAAFIIGCIIPGKAALDGRALIDSLLSEVPKVKRDTNAVKLLCLLSWNYYITNTDSGLFYGNQALEIANEIEYKRGIATAKAALASNYSAKAMTGEATTNYLEALEIYEEIGDKRGIINSYGNIAMLYSIVEKYDHAINYYHKTLYMAKELNSEIDLARNFGNLGIVFKHLKKMDSARFYLEKSIQVNEKLGNRNYLAVNYFNLGAICIDDSLYIDAYHHTMKAFDIANDIGNKRLVALIYINLGTIYKANYFYPKKLNPRPDFLFKDDKQNLFKSIEYLEKGREILIGLDDKKNLIEANDYLYEALILNHDFRKAAEVKEHYFALQDSILTDETRKQMAFLDAKSELELKDQEIRLSALELEKKNNLLLIAGFAFVVLAITAFIFYRMNVQKRRINQKLIEQSKIISDQVATKDKFFSIIAHDLRNPISSMAQSVNMIDQEFDSFSEEEIREFIGDLNKSSKNVYALLEDLLTWSRSQRGMIEAHKERYNARDIAARAISQLESQASAKKIELVNTVDEIETAYIDANLTITMLRNLLSNAIKFSYEGSQVELGFNLCEDGKKSFIVTDHGVGMDQRTIDILFRIDSAYSGIGTSGEKGTGLGLIVCKEFADKQNGSITVESQLDKGSIFSYSFPDDECDD
jgi:signal transduction histidine kinase